MKKFNNLVNSHLTKSIENYDKLSTFVHEFMHLDKQRHNVWVVTKQQKLTLMTDNPYLGIQLRYQQDSICLALNKRFLMQLKTVKVKIIPPEVTASTQKEDLFKIGSNAKEILNSIADEINDDELRNSLLKLTRD